MDKKKCKGIEHVTQKFYFQPQRTVLVCKMNPELGISITTTPDYLSR